MYTLYISFGNVFIGLQSYHRTGRQGPGLSACIRIHRNLRALPGSLVLQHAATMAAAHPGGIHSTVPAGKHLLCHQHIVLCHRQGIVLPPVRVHIGPPHIHERHILAHLQHAYLLEAPGPDIPLNPRRERICPNQHRRSPAAGCTL